MCDKLPDCKYGQQCFSIHPLCENDGECKLPGCIYTHMKQKPVEVQKPQFEKKQPQQQTKKKDSQLEEIRGKVNAIQELVSKSDLVMQGHIAQVFMKLSLLEKEIENDKKNLATQMSKNSRLEKQLKEASAKIEKLSSSNPRSHLFTYPGINLDDVQPISKQVSTPKSIFDDPLFQRPNFEAHHSSQNQTTSSNISISNYPVLTPTSSLPTNKFGMTPFVPESSPLKPPVPPRKPTLADPNAPIKVQHMTFEPGKCASNIDAKRVQEEKKQVEIQLQNVLHNNVDLLEQNDLLRKRLEALEKKSF
uniref:Uncharacterized protein n=1 Tax=Acrobeloides nanus TaxID=290746 RepID=A0A914CE30_9BILA